MKTNIKLRALSGEKLLNKIRNGGGRVEYNQVMRFAAAKLSLQHYNN